MQTIIRSVSGVLVAIALNLSATGAHATTLGLSTDPMGSAWARTDPNSAYAVWDSFESTSFTGEAPGSSFDLTNPTLSQSSVFTNLAQGAGLYNVAISTPTASNGDVLFAGGNTVNFTIDGAVDFSIYGLTLRLSAVLSG